MISFKSLYIYITLSLKMILLIIPIKHILNSCPSLIVDYTLLPKIRSIKITKKKKKEEEGKKERKKERKIQLK